jgi:stringent starvation protein B
MHEWLVDCGLTPHVMADAGIDGLVVPDSAIQDGRVVLNISLTAVRDLFIDADGLSFVARFGGVSQAVMVPMAAVTGIYARENGHGMLFPDEDAPTDGDGLSDGLSDDAADSGNDQTPQRPNLRVIK